MPRRKAVTLPTLEGAGISAGTSAAEGEPSSPLPWAVDGGEPYGWYDEEALKQNHSLRVVGRAYGLLHYLCVGIAEYREPAASKQASCLAAGITGAIHALARHGEYDALGWMIYGLEGLLDEEVRRELVPLCDDATEVSSDA